MKKKKKKHLKRERDSMCDNIHKKHTCYAYVFFLFFNVCFLCTYFEYEKKKVSKRARVHERIRVIDFVEFATPADDSYSVSWTEG